MESARSYGVNHAETVPGLQPAREQKLVLQPQGTELSQQQYELRREAQAPERKMS